MMSNSAKRLPRIVLPILAFFLAGCVTSVDGRLPFQRLPALSVTIPVRLAASPSHPTSYLQAEPIPAGASVQVIAADADAAWLLVMQGANVGWMPTFFSRTNIGAQAPPMEIEPLDVACTQYLGSTATPGERWRNTLEGKVLVQGLIYRPSAGNAFGDAALEIGIQGAGRVAASDFVHTPLTASSAVVLFGYALENMSQSSQLTFDLQNAGDESLVFQAAFFSDECGVARNNGAAPQTRLPVGRIKGVSPPSTPPTRVPPTLTPRRTPAPQATPTRTRVPVRTPTPTRRFTPTPVIIVVTSAPDIGASTRREIEALLDRWDDVHHEADRTLQATDLASALTGEALREQREALQTLDENNCYWEFTDRAEPRILELHSLSSTEIIAYVGKHWDGDLYCNGNYDRHSSFDQSFTIRYRIVRTGSGWRIAEKEQADYESDSATPTPVSTSVGARTVCADTYPTRLQINTRAYLNSDRRNNVRSGPGTGNPILDQIQPDELVTIIDGPACVQGMIWWLVDNSTLTAGWTSEGDSDQYWLAPLTP